MHLLGNTDVANMSPSPKYLSEVFEGDEVNLSVASDGSGKLHVLGSKSGEDAAVYLMEVVC